MSKKQQPTECGKCGHSLKMHKFKDDEAAKLTCPDCGWRPGDKKSKSKKAAPTKDTKTADKEIVKASAGMLSTKLIEAPKKVKARRINGVVAKPANGQNPYRIGGGYWSSVEALRTLGIGRMHSFEGIIVGVKAVMGKEALRDFKAKDARNEETGKDCDARIIQNVSVVARPDYGAKLRANHLEVRFSGREKTAGLFRI